MSATALRVPSPAHRRRSAVRERIAPGRPSPASVPRGDTARWDAVLARDHRADGRFVFAVRTTGVYCRPSCPARRPRRENVAFFADPDAAERSGFRACRRCHPREASVHDHQAGIVRAACELLEREDDEVRSLAALAKRIGYSPWHLHRMFRRHTGLTPRQYARSRRLARLRQRLQEGSHVTTALYDSGFGSPSRVYQDGARELGMTPGAYRRGGSDVAIRYAIAPSALGPVLVAATERGVCSVRFGSSPATLERGLREEFPNASLTRDQRRLRRALRVVAAGIDGRAVDPALPLDVHATAFQRRVWEALRAIPRGRTASYADIARAVGAPRAARAVGRACATNPVAVLIPCHRAVRRDGGPGGYAWGVARKRALLARERGPAA